jgi:hypothetical protein
VAPSKRPARRSASASRVGDRSCRKAAITRVSCEERTIAQIFAAAATIEVDAARMAEPWNSDTFADARPLDASPYRVDAAYNHVAWNDRQHWIRQFAIDDMEVGAANVTRISPGPGNRSGNSVHSSGAPSALSTIACIAALDFNPRRRQCETSAHKSARRRRSRVTPPRTHSRKRLCPYAPATITPAPCSLAIA